jgi:hypothetical protein
VSVVHVVVAFQVHDAGAFGFVGFFFAAGRPLTNGFGLGNWTGAAALVVVVGLSQSPPTAPCANCDPGAGRTSSD